MFGEPNGNQLPLYAANDFLKEKSFLPHTNVTEDELVLEGSVNAAANATQKVTYICCKDQCFNLIEFGVDNQTYKNHYYTRLLNISYHDSLRDLTKSGLNDVSF